MTSGIAPGAVAVGANVGALNTAVMRVGLISLGCAKNRVDGEVMLGNLVRGGCEITPEVDDADVVIVNTCGFITDAKQESIDTILEVAELRRSGQVRRLLVAGCMAQQFAQELADEIPEIDGFVGLDELDAVVERVRLEERGGVPDQRASVAVYDHNRPRLLTTAGYAYLKVAEGCNNPCQFCSIPKMRGRFRSRPMDDLVQEAQQLERAGVNELVLIAQDTTRYGEDLDGGNGLRQLVEALLEGTEIPWIRFLYAYPTTLDRGLFDLMAREPRFLSYLDIPLQHASRRVLQAMRRGGQGGRFLDMLAEARRRVPDIAVRTTMIVGFPGEGEAEFTELLDFIEAAQFDHLGVFTYAWQEENPGAELGDPVDEAVKTERRNRVMELQQGISEARNQALVGRRLEALVEGPLPEMELLTQGRLARHAPEIDGRLIINDGWAPPGSLVEVEITEAHPYDLVGTIVATVREGRPTLGSFAV